MFIQLSLALSAKAKEIKTASPIPCQMDNPKFAMRTWLNSLGMIGEEFETARKWLTQNLEGDAAFRFGRETASGLRAVAPWIIPRTERKVVCLCPKGIMLPTGQT